jgi:hypothetical protein
MKLQTQRAHKIMMEDERKRREPEWVLHKSEARRVFLLWLLKSKKEPQSHQFHSKASKFRDQTFMKNMVMDEIVLGPQI